MTWCFLNHIKCHLRPHLLLFIVRDLANCIIPLAEFNHYILFYRISKVCTPISTQKFLLSKLISLNSTIQKGLHLQRNSLTLLSVNTFRTVRERNYAGSTSFQMTELEEMSEGSIIYTQRVPHIRTSFESPQPVV